VQNGNLQCRYINFVRRLFIDECGVVCMSELFDSEFINKIQRIALSRGIIVTGGAGGNRKSRQKGSSVEFSDYREYSEGDDFRRIDWNAYGRFEKLYSGKLKIQHFTYSFNKPGFSQSGNPFQKNIPTTQNSNN
jgi:hypothetical protein